LPSTRPAKVLHVRIATGTGGGPEKTILSSPKHLARTPWPAHVCYLHLPGDPGFEVIEERARRRGAPLTGLPERFPLNPFTLLKLRKLSRGLGARVWHGHDYKSNLFGLLLRPFLGHHLVTTVHGWVRNTARTPLYYAIDKWCLKRYERVITVSTDLEAECHNIGCDPARVIHIPNAIDSEEFSRSAPRPEAEGRPLVIGALARLSREKGFELLIEAVERLAEEGHDVQLKIAGEGELEGELRAQMSSSKHAERFELTGYIEDVPAFLEGLDLYCLSSLREGLPNSVLEAMSFELPVLSTRCGGMESFLRDGEDGMLIETGSCDALLDGLRTLAADAPLRARLGAAARARILADCSFKERMERVVAVYESLDSD
jgi:glycosyltransferase involved in cell wall biosynthesis